MDLKSEINLKQNRIDETQYYLAESKPVSKEFKLNLRLNAITNNFDKLDQSLKKYEVEIQDANKLLLIRSARFSNRSYSANSNNK